MKKTRSSSDEKPKKRKPGGGRKADPEQTVVKDRLGVKDRQARKLRKQGVTLDNLESIEGARLAKVRVEIRVLKEKLAIMQREHVPAAKVREDAVSAFSVLRAEIGAQEVQLPPLLEGLTAKEMRTVLAGHGERMLKDLSERIEAIA